VKYGFIKRETVNFPVTALCRVMRVDRSSYYEWLKKPVKVDLLEMRQIAETKRLFKLSRKSYGARRISEELTKNGLKVGRCRAKTLMKKAGLVVQQKRRFKVTTDSRHHYPVAENLLNREFNPGAPNQAWGSDITYVWTMQGWLYLAVIIDFYSRRVVGWCIDDRMTKALATRALTMAINLRQPPPDLIHHSDRGSQYASHEYQKILKLHRIRASMSRKGNCWDNAPTERFFSSLKREWIGDQIYQTKEQARRDIREFVAIYYNAIRPHSTLGYQTPVEFEKSA
jgi:transposase InsO family protein